MAETAEFNTTTLIVDDTSNLIEYSAGWTSGFSGDGVSDVDAEYMRTKHGAKTAGLTAKFNFTGTVYCGIYSFDHYSLISRLSPGTSIAVYGSVGSVDVYGVPISSYSVDDRNTTTYTAPIIQPGGFLTHVAFYQSPILPPGTHELVITNLNGSVPSVLWIDFFYYDPTGETGGGAALIPSSSTDLFTVSSMSTTISSSSSMLASPGATPSSFPKHASIDAILGGTVGGISALLLLSSSALLFQWYRRRRLKQTDLYEHESTISFGS